MTLHFARYIYATFDFVDLFTLRLRITFGLRFVPRFYVPTFVAVYGYTVYGCYVGYGLLHCLIGCTFVVTFVILCTRYVTVCLRLIWLRLRFTLFHFGCYVWFTFVGCYVTLFPTRLLRLRFYVLYRLRLVIYVVYVVAVDLFTVVTLRLRLPFTLVVYGWLVALVGLRYVCCYHTVPVTLLRLRFTLPFTLVYVHGYVCLIRYIWLFGCSPVYVYVGCLWLFGFHYVAVPFYVGFYTRLHVCYTLLCRCVAVTLLVCSVLYSCGYGYLHVTFALFPRLRV